MRYTNCKLRNNNCLFIFSKLWKVVWITREQCDQWKPYKGSMMVWSRPFTNVTTGQSYKGSTIVNFGSWVVPNMGHFQVRYNSRVVIYDHRAFIRLTTVVGIQVAQLLQRVAQNVVTTVITQKVMLLKYMVFFWWTIYYPDLSKLTPSSHTAIGNQYKIYNFINLTLLYHIFPDENEPTLSYYDMDQIQQEVLPPGKDAFKLVRILQWTASMQK